MARKALARKREPAHMINIRQDDSVLIARFQNGTVSAFDTLIHKHQARAYQYAFRLSRDSEQAGDVVAETFVRIYKALPNFKGESAFTTWMYRILTNCFLDMRKRELSRPHLSLDGNLQTEEGDLEVQIMDPSDSPLQESEQNERARTIGAAIQKLVPYQRAMIYMYHVEMLSYEEMAIALSLPIGTVKSRLNRSRLALRALLHDDRELLAVA
jgi:RNA polymerase sigma-70 factor (ECF subfamily)